MWLPILGLIVGLILGSIFTFQIPVFYAKYLGVALLAGLDSVFGGIKAVMDDSFDSTILLTGFFTNTLLAAFLAYVGDRLGVELYLAAVFAFGVRLFQNLAGIRRIIVLKRTTNER
ncbi:small basic protein [Desulfitispora alkaliphila]|uniref:small basic family protein n=1 Tax=Desulfitispora alkaliphila TaxID=622674 RepID=UPI003D1A8870